MICKKCNAGIPDDSMFCPSCGQKVESEYVVVPAPVFSSAFRQASSLDGDEIGTRDVGKEINTRDSNYSTLISASDQQEPSSENSIGCSCCGEKDEKSSQAPVARNNWFVPAGGFEDQLSGMPDRKVDVPVELSKHLVCEEQASLVDPLVREDPVRSATPVATSCFIPTKTPAERRFCRKCGVEISTDSLYCSKCEFDANSEKCAGFTKPRKKWLWVGIVAAVLVCIIVAVIPLVLRNASVSESQIKDDMRGAMSQYLDDSFSLDSITITKRQTETSDKTDTVYLEWTAHNSVCSVENEAVMTYQLYNDGWMFENINSHRTTTTITASNVSAESARTEAESGYIPQKYEGGDWIEVARETDLPSGEDIFIYNYKIYFYYCTRTYTARVKYKFYNTSWSYDSVEWDDGVSDWDIDGEWTCYTKDAQVWIKIHSFEDRQGTLEYSIKFDYQGWYYYGVQNFYTDEPVSVYGSKHTDTDRIEYLQIDLPSRNASSEHAEAGYLELYPSAMYWNSLHAKDDVYKLEPSDGSSSVKLSELFVTEDNSYWHWPLEYIDPDGDSHDEFYQYASYKSMWNDGLESYALYELEQQYSTISGTYFCSPEMPSDVGISFYIYADGVCIYKDEHLYVGDGVRTFTANISGNSKLKISAVCDDSGTHNPSPMIILVDTYLY